MILATRDGARLSAAAQSFAMTREQEAELRTAAEQMAEKLADNEDVITPSAAKTVVEAIGTIGQGSHPERGTVYALATVKNLALVLVGGAAIATPAIIGAFLGSAMVGAAVGSPISLLLVEAVKKNAAFVALTSQLGARFEAMSDLEISRWVEQKASSLVPFRSFVLSNERALRKIAGLASELKWMLRYIDFMSDEDRKNLS
jgi:uncharacterized protein with PIN domain